MPATRIVLAIVTAAVVTAATSCSSGAPKTADQVMADISAKVPNAKIGIVYTAESDPNHLLGRPTGYTSKVSFTDSRVDPQLIEGQRADAIDAGGSVEVYPDAEGAQRRQNYIQGLQEAAPIFGTEYSYLDGAVLIRVSGKLTPTQAAEYEAALQ